MTMAISFSNEIWTFLRAALNKGGLIEGSFPGERQGDRINRRRGNLGGRKAGGPLKQISFQLRPLAPFRLDFTAWVLKRRKDKDQGHVACPDPFNPVIMELRRVKN